MLDAFMRGRMSIFQEIILLKFASYSALKTPNVRVGPLVILAFKTSPSLTIPTPCGVPVKIKSPSDRVNMEER